MGYRRRKRRYKGSGRRWPEQRREEEGGLDLLAQALINGVVALLRWMVRPLTRRRSKPESPVPGKAVRYKTAAPAGVRGKVRGEKFPKAPLMPTPRYPHLEPPPPLAYRPKKQVMSKGERAFWNPLYRAVKGRYRLFCKVRLADVVDSPEQYVKGQKGFRSIQGFHVDFVLCEPKTTAPLLVIELDDKTHSSSRSRELDGFKDAVLASAGIPILRIPAQSAYAPSELAEAIDGLLRRH